MDPGFRILQSDELGTDLPEEGGKFYLKFLWVAGSPREIAEVF